MRAVLPEHLHKLRFHDLRHTYATLLVEQGAHPKEMAELMGHSSVQITLDRYSHVMPRMTSVLADRIDSAYRNAGLVEPPVDEDDSVVVLEPADIVAAEPDERTGLRRLYVVLTRAVSALAVVHARPLPAALAHDHVPDRGSGDSAGT